MPRKFPATLIVVDEDDDGRKTGAPLKRLLHAAEERARQQRKPKPSEAPVISGAEAKRERRRQRNLDRV